MWVRITSLDIYSVTLEDLQGHRFTLASTTPLCITQLARVVYAQHGSMQIDLERMYRHGEVTGLNR